MCLQDIKIGSRLQARVSVTSVADGVTTRLLGRDPNRLRVHFSAPQPIAPAAGQLPVFIAVGESGNVQNVIGLMPNDPNYLFRVEDYGQLVYDNWWITNATGAVVTVTAVEFFDPQGLEGI